MEAEIRALIKGRADGWQPGDQLPTYKDLADQLGTSVGTIARVIKTLRDAELIVGVPGRGTYVAE